MHELMETIYLVIVIILFVLAISDLIVGVSNDAVNFLNSSLGSKVAPVKVIMIIASIGVLFGTTFSSGMMEVARKGIFHPEHFFFSEIMVIFIAVMLTDVILLDLFNTVGLPTSTTVSIVFELLGAAVAVSIFKISQAGESIIQFGQYINTDKALAIISGIFLSVIIAFTVGALVMYISRIIFSFQYKKSIKYFGGIFGGIAITAITYFILIKGAKGSSLITGDTLKWIKQHSVEIMLYGFVGWTIILQLLNWIFRLDILKIIVLVGTFALAMAFAGNDLVNFIGVPLAGLKSYQAFIAEGTGNPDGVTMEVLTQSVKSNTFLLLIAGAIMTITLWFSKKAKRVVKTSIDLSSQNEENERFTSSAISRSLIRLVKNIGSGFNFIIPSQFKKAINKRFEVKEEDPGQKAKDRPAFDLIRASVNLVVASILIAFGTSLKLPLSTTYVTFMVAMGTSLADRAWGRETAVYRITGVLTVIAGWFLTAIVAFITASIFASIIHFGSFGAIFVLLGIAVFIVIKMHLLHKKKQKLMEEESDDKWELIEGEMPKEKLIVESTKSFTSIFEHVAFIYKKTIDDLCNMNRKNLKKLTQEVAEHNKRTKYLKNNVNKTINLFSPEDAGEVSFYYIQLVNDLREITHCIRYITIPAFEHVDNNHKGLVKQQQEELKSLSKEFEKYIEYIVKTMQNKESGNYEKIHDMQEKITDDIATYQKNQIKRIKNKSSSTKNGLLFLNILEESKMIALNLQSFSKTFVQFIES